MTYETYPFCFLTILLVIGILFHSSTRGFGSSGITILVILLTLVVGFIVLTSRTKFRLFLISLMMIGVGFLVSHLDHYKLHKTKNHYLDKRIEFSLTGTIVHHRDLFDGNKEYTLADLRHEGNKIFGKTLLRPGMDSLAIGDQITVVAKNIYPIKSLNNPLEFNYSDYLSRNNVWGRIYPSSIVHQSGDNYLSHLKKYQQFLNASLVKGVSNPKSKAVVSAMVLGQKSGLDRDLRSLFSQVGMAHVLAVSGLHMGVVSGILLGFLWIMRYLFGWYDKQIFLVTIPLLIVYCIITGASASTVRAVAMVSLYLFGRVYLKKKLVPLEIVAVVAMIFLVTKPTELYSISFLLSFTAVLGIILHFRDFHRWAPIQNKILMYSADAFFIGLVCTFYCAPLLIYFFHEVSWIGPFLSFFATLIAFVMITVGMLSLLLSPTFLGYEFSKANGKVADLLLNSSEKLGAMETSLQNLWIGDGTLILGMAFSYFILKLLSGKIRWLIPTSLLLFLIYQTNRLEQYTSTSKPHIEISNTYTDWQMTVFQKGTALTYSTTEEPIVKTKLYRLSPKSRKMRPLPPIVQINGTVFQFWEKGQFVHESADYILTSELDSTSYAYLKNKSPHIICKRADSDLSPDKSFYEMQSRGPIRLSLTSDKRISSLLDENPD